MAISALSLFAGCISPQARRGQVLEPQIGASSVDFTYIENTGEPRNFRQKVGDFTVLAFTKCHSQTHGPASRQLEALVGDNQSPGVARTVGFDIHWSEFGCEYNEKCHLLAATDHLYSLCDSGGAVRKVYGVDSEDVVFVIGPDARIVEKGTAGDFDAFSVRFGKLFRAHVAEHIRQTDTVP